MTRLSLPDKILAVDRALAASFIPAIPGTTHYLDELWQRQQVLTPASSGRRQT